MTPPSGTPTRDVFVGHASDDKTAFVRDLVAALKANPLNVWCDEHEIGLGDDVRKKMDEGLRTSRFGVVIVSPNFSK